MSNAKKTREGDNLIISHQNLELVNTDELYGNSPGCRFPNPVTIGNLEVFSPPQCDAPQISDVEVMTPEGKRVEKKIIDGHTRVAYLRDKIGTNLTDYPEWNFDEITVNNVTRSLINNPMIVFPEEKPDAEARGALIPKQYIRAVIPHVREHSLIIEPRTAANLIGVWESLVGRENAKQFPAIGALNLLRKKETPEDWKHFSASQGTFVPEETSEQREQILDGLMEMAYVIYESKLNVRDVTLEALRLISTDSPAIGGEQTAERELLGLVDDSIMQRRLAQEFNTPGEIAQQSVNLGKLVVQAGKRLTDDLDNLDVIIDTLKDSDLKIGQLTMVLTADDPQKMYDKIRREITKTRLMESYSEIVLTENAEISRLEQDWINRLGNQFYIPNQDYPIYVKAIVSARETRNVAYQTMDRLKGLKEEGDSLLEEKGVNTDTLRKGILELGMYIDNLYRCASVDCLTSTTKEIADVIRETEEQIARQLATFKSDQMVCKTYIETMPTTSGEKVNLEQGPTDEEISARVSVEQLRRIEQANKLFGVETNNYGKKLGEFSGVLGPDTITDENKLAAQQVIKGLGEIVYDQDILSVVEDEYPTLRQSMLKLRRQSLNIE